MGGFLALALAIRIVFFCREPQVHLGENFKRSHELIS